MADIVNVFGFYASQTRFLGHTSVLAIERVLYWKKEHHHPNITL
jgi:hypothetical protein